MRIIVNAMVVLFVAIIFSSGISSNNSTGVGNLECEYLINPIGIDVTTPRLSWKIETAKNNFKQTAYRILVASEIKNLENNIGNLWDTKKVLSEKSFQVYYDGKKLKSGQKVFWKVKVWDQNNNESTWSKTATWEMGLLKESDWKAKWIGKIDKRKVKAGQKNPAPYFRKTFNIKNDIKSARVYIAGLGYYELYLNGKKVSDQVLSPNQTNYDKRQVKSYEKGKIANMSTRVLYVTYDVTDYLQKGENVIGVILGNGWYFQTERREYLPLYFDTPRFITQIKIKGSDGTEKQIISDNTWKVSTGPILDNNIYLGEIYDARLEKPNWNNLGFDDSGWDYAKIVRKPEGKLHAQMSPPDRITKTIKPVSINSPKEGIYRYDFGTMFSGWTKIKIKGERGTKIKLKYFEDSGNTYGQTDTYIFKGEGIEEWHPRFTWHAFRYVEIESPSIKLDLENIIGQVVHSDVKAVGSFNSSNKLFNQIYTDYVKTQLDNMHGSVPTDCPHRERRGYTGDGQIAAQAAIYSLDMRSFYTKWLNDIADAQNKVTGYVPNTVPYHSGGGGVAWGSAYVIIPWYMYLYYGDVDILKKHYKGMKKYIQYLSNRTYENGLIRIAPDDYWDLGEWVPPISTVIPKEFVASAYYYFDLTLMKKIANVLNKKNDVKQFLNVSENVKKSFNKKYYYPDKQSYSIGYQGANVFPLAFGIVTKENEQKVFKSLVKNIEVKNKGHFDTGMMATPYLLEVLTKYGRVDLAYTLMDRRDYPSYGYNIERGATTLWETWTGNESHSHPMFGSVCAWFYQALGGINPDPISPGFKHIIIKPNLISEMKYVHNSYQSIYGEIKSEWKLKNNELELNVKIPPNTTASVFIPGNDNHNVNVNNAQAVFVNVKDNFVQYSVPSGKYKFIAKKIGELVKTSMLPIPKISPADPTLFYGDSVMVNIIKPVNNSEVRYTLDGTEPNENSELFTRPIFVNKTTVIKAKVFKKNYKSGFTSVSRIDFIDSLKNGVNYKYYIGAWNKLPDFDKLKPSFKGKIYNFNLNNLRTYADKFAVEFTSNIKIDNEDLYTFYLMSNDGSKLFIDDKLVIDFDGLHGSSTKTGKIKLSKGIHKIKIEYFQAGGGLGLEVFYKSNKIEKQKIPASILFTKVSAK